MKLSTFLAAVCWSSVIVLVWLLLFRQIKVDGLSISAFAFFFIVAFLASLSGQEPKKHP